MERESTKHSPRLDEQLDHDTRSLQQGAAVEARAEEEREQEGEAGVGPTPDVLLASTGREPGLSHGQVEARSTLARWLRPSAFPADRGRLLSTARDEHAPERVIAALGRLPDGVVYPNLERVWEALGGPVERRA
jgi:hypothetical protein